MNVEIPRRDPAGAVPLTPAQERLWFLDRAGYGGAAYVHGTTFRLTGRLDRVALADAVDLVVARHEALRTAIVDVGGRPRQEVRAVTTRLDLIDVSAADDPHGRAVAVATDVLAGPFDFARPPLLRAALVRLAAEEHLLVVGLHHIICDGASIAVLVDEVFTAYRGHALEPVAVQFPDYARWLADRSDDDAAADRAYWRGQLAGAPARTTLTGDRAPTGGPGQRGGQHRVGLDRTFGDRLRDLARRERCTPFVAALAALAGVLARHTGEDDVVVGAPADGRDLPELDRAVGMFVNTLALRVRLGDDPTLRDLLRLARRAALGAMAHQRLPFDAVVDELRIPRDPTSNPLFQVMLVVEPVGPADFEAAPGLTVGMGPAATPQARFDLTVVLLNGPAPELVVDYAADRYRPETVERFAGHLVRLLDALTGDPDRRLSDVDILGPAERALLLGGTARQDEPPDVLALIRARAAERPHDPAVLGEGIALTYGDLDGRADALASLLRSAGVGPETVVGVLATGGAEPIVAVLGVLRAGGAYLPVDPAHPAGRVAAMLADASVTIVVAADLAAPALTGFVGTVVVPPGTRAGRSALVGPPVEPVPADRLAYIIYTSGSTGRPKGVAVEHGTLARLTRAFVARHGLGPGDRLLMVPPLTFDASVGDLFPALAAGAALVLYPEPARLDGPELVRHTVRHGVSVIDAPVVLLRRWAADLAATPPPAGWPVRAVMVGGDRVPLHLVRAFAAATGGRVDLFNHYGPTEATVCATTHRTVDGADAGDATYLPIGAPLPHVRAYVLDRRGAPAPVGAPGELFLGGDCLARGYTDADLTAERFGPDPHGSGRVYRTGDLARWTADGVLEFLGRTDRQVKINGHRIEPSEVEAAVSEHPGVREVAVLAVTDDGRERLAAFVVAAGGGVPADLRTFLRERLPHALVPAVVVAVDAIARTAHGKLDEAVLRAAFDRHGAGRPLSPPAGPVESALAEIWAAELGVDAVGRSDNFFDLGGTSLRVAAVLDRIADRLGARLPLRALFDSDDLAGLARAIADRGAPEEEQPDLRAEAVLPPDVRPDPVVRRIRRAEPTVLLTGATGFLGAHLLAELLGRGAGTVVCLVRADGPAHALDRIRQNLNRYGLRTDVPARVVALPGDLTVPRFGLTDEGYADLAGRVDVVVHNGGEISFRQPYRRLRPSNVDGTVEALRLAASAGGAALHLVSTLGVYLGKAYLDRPVTEAEPPDDPTELGGGYNQSKWVGDAVARLARDRGLPVSVHRPARIVADSRTGRGNDDDFFSRFVRGCVQLGSVPDLPYEEDLFPVDTLAAGIAALALGGGGAAPRDYHYFGATVSYRGLADALRGRGLDVTFVPWRRWRAAAVERCATGGPFALADSIDLLPEDESQVRRPLFDCRATRAALAAVGVTEPPVGAVLGRLLDDLLAGGGSPM